MNFDLYWHDYARIFLALGGMLTIPGWAFISVNGYWKRWKPLQRWIIAIGISIAFYPILFYWARSVIPSLQIGPNKNLVLLAVLGLWIMWHLRCEWRAQFKFDRLEWAAILVIAGTLFTRYWIAYTHPFPAWSDSLHHTLLTELVGISGRLPTTLEPYAPTPLDMYHLGLYSLTGTVQQLANISAHTALLWTAQTLNGLCGLGVYLILDRKVNRIGAIAGAVVVGLLSHMPAWYVNWGRFTQISSQTILLIAWMVTWEAIESWKLDDISIGLKIHPVFLAGILNTSVFLLHFRVAGFYLPLLFLNLGWTLFRSKTISERRKLLTGILSIGLIALFLLLPGGISAVGAYVKTKSAQVFSPNTDFSYFKFPLSTVPQLVAEPWLLILSFIGLLVVCISQHKLGLLMVSWSLVLIGIGNLYHLKIPLLSFTNQGAILIMQYLPIGVTLGIAMAELYGCLSKRLSPSKVLTFFIGAFLVAGIWGGYQRIQGVEESRYFVTEADLQAMEWIKQNTPLDSTFAISTYMWLNSLPHGIDGGYWIPYFTGRATTSNTMLTPLERGDFYHRIFDMSKAAAGVNGDFQAVQELADTGVQYIYIGSLQSEQFQGTPLFLEIDQLMEKQILDLVYSHNGIWILRIMV